MMNLGDISVLASIIAGIIAIPFAASTITIGNDYAYGLSAIMNSTALLADSSVPGFSSKTVSDDLIEYVYQTPEGKFVIRIYDGRFETTLTNIGRKVSSVQSPDGQVWSLLLPTESLVINQTNQRTSEVYKNLDGYLEIIKDGGTVFTTTRGTASESALQQGMSRLEQDLNYSLSLIANMSSYILNITSQPPTQQNSIVINEFVSYPNTNETEWIELYNPTNNSIDLTNWIVEDGVGIIKTLSGSIENNSYIVVNISSKLNNDGDIIKLRSDVALVDSVTYGNWNDGNTVDNAPKPLQRQSVGRSPNGIDTDVDSSDFVRFVSPSPEAANL